ncbi:MAG: arylsulfatase A-like enzyme [Kiritimatiellia bacterium]|jgi:arylsulfatase A-like enzyme
MIGKIFIALLLAFTMSLEARKPNIVFFYIDDMGYADPSCFGNPIVKTPRIDQLAKEGIKLTNYYSNSPICSPSRVAVTTGQFPGRWKIHSYLNSRAGNASRGMRDYLDASAPTTAKKLQAAGYATAHFGKWHMGGGRDVDDAPLPTEYGFDETLVAFEGLGDRLLTNPKNASVNLGRGEISFCTRAVKTEKYTDRTIDFIQRNKDQPFYVRLFPNDVHDPHDPAEGSTRKWEAQSESSYDHRFFAVLEEMDRQLGRVIDCVEALGLSEDTLFIFTSDNGPTDWPKYYKQVKQPPGFTGPFFGRKWSLYEGGVRMPFIARWKGTIPAGVTDDTSIVSAIDLSPTFCHFAGVEVPAAERLDGFDASEVLLGRKWKRPQPVFWQYGGPHARLKPGKLEYISPSFAIRDGDWKFLVNPDGSEAQLFHLPDDPGEQHNRAAREPERTKTLQAALAGWAKDTGFAFDGQATLSGPMPGVAAEINGQLFPFENHGVKLEANHWRFNGKAWLDLPRSKAPELGKDRVIRIKARVSVAHPNGVVVAHGGNRWGYSLYVEEGKPAFCATTDWNRTVITATDAIDGLSHDWEVKWNREGRLELRIDQKLVAKGTAPDMLTTMPGDSIQIGADLIQPVADYEVPNGFSGTIESLNLYYAR